MSTELTTHTGEPVATRTYGGMSRGMVVLVHLTKEEFKAYAGQLASVEGVDDPEVTCAQVVGAWVMSGANVEYATPELLNKQARDLENHRFNGSVEALSTLAAEMRDRARQATRDSLRVVA